MALIDRDTFDAAKARAAAEWRARGDGETAALFAALEHERCGFGLQSGMRVCWRTVSGRRIGMLFGLEDGGYLRSFVYRPAAEPPGARTEGPRPPA